uniref:ornithine decarboxylase n=2 Tax=Plectus sambesii TaxID=2011161 RepID=A0A914V787_9BILA
MTQMYGDARVTVFQETVSPLSVTQDIARAKTALDEDDAFLLMDLGMVLQRFELWTTTMPRVEPFYAVKCNSDPILMRVLADCGAGFDCASKKEIDLVLDNGLTSPDRIIYANPCKTRNYIKHALNRGVDMMTFDNEEELLKIRELHPNAKMVLRIAIGDPTATCQLNVKFGCDPVKEGEALLATAARLGVAVIGISFHVGSGCNDPTAFGTAIAHARRLFNDGIRLGHSMTLLDLGGGYPGYDNERISFPKIAAVINRALEEYFPETDDSVRIIAEPGRYFAAAPYSLTTNIIAKTKVPASRVTNDAADSDQEAYMYYMNDGVYGSFNCVFYDHVHPVGVPLFHESADDDDQCKTPALLWGPTCDGLDLVQPNFRVRRLVEGDWLYFKNMGAYTHAAGSEFNGFARPKLYYFIDQNAWMELLAKRLHNVAPFSDEDEKHSEGGCESGGYSSGFASDSDSN